jgi:hypothetical protein
LNNKCEFCEHGNEPTYSIKDGFPWLADELAALDKTVLCNLEWLGIQAGMLKE